MMITFLVQRDKSNNCRVFLLWIIVLSFMKKTEHQPTKPIASKLNVLFMFARRITNYWRYTDSKKRESDENAVTA